MKTNVGSIDRIVRILLGIAIIAVGAYYQTWWGAVGSIPLITGALNFCPVYFLLGLSTAEVESEHDAES